MEHGSWSNYGEWGSMANVCCADYPLGLKGRGPQGNTRAGRPWQVSKDTSNADFDAVEQAAQYDKDGKHRLFWGGVGRKIQRMLEDNGEETRAEGSLDRVFAASSAALGGAQPLARANGSATSRAEDEEQEKRRRRAERFGGSSADPSGSGGGAAKRDERRLWRPKYVSGEGERPGTGHAGPTDCGEGKGGTGCLGGKSGRSKGKGSKGDDSATKKQKRWGREHHQETLHGA